MQIAVLEGREYLRSEDLQKHMHVHSCIYVVVWNILIFVVHVREANRDRLIYVEQIRVGVPTKFVVEGSVAMPINPTRTILLE